MKYDNVIKKDRKKKRFWRAKTESEKLSRTLESKIDSPFPKSIDDFLRKEFQKITNNFVQSRDYQGKMHINTEDPRWIKGREIVESLSDEERLALQQKGKKYVIELFENRLREFIYKEAIICIFGSRGINNYNMIKQIVLKHLEDFEYKPIEFVSGNAKGNENKKGCPDQVNEILSLELLGKESNKFDPKWKKYGRGAGLRRNIDMIKYLLEKKKEGYEVLTFGFWDGVSKGTKHMIDNLEKKNIPLIIFLPERLGNEYKRLFLKSEIKEIDDIKNGK